MKVYVVQGSEDGVLEVYSSARLAVAHAEAYVRASDDSGARLDNDEGQFIDYSEDIAAKMLRKDGFVTVYDSGNPEYSVSADVRRFEVITK